MFCISSFIFIMKDSNVSFKKKKNLYNFKQIFWNLQSLILIYYYKIK